MANVLICDDCGQDRSNLKKALLRLTLSEKLNITFADSLEQLWFRADDESLRPDIVLLDIEFANCAAGANGIEAAEKMQQAQINCQIIFISAHTNYFEQVYSAEHVAFLSKPVKPEYLARAMERALRKIRSTATESIAVTSNRKSVILSTAHIVYAERLQKLTLLHLTDGETVTTYEKLDSIMERCVSLPLVRCHKSFAFSLMQVAKYKSDRLLMKSGAEIPVSRHYQEQVHQVIMHFVTGGETHVG